MKGVILAGGTGSRLFPSTKVTNKHLLPVYDRPMIYYPIQTLRESGINEILIISSPEHAGDFMQLLGSGTEFNVQLTYRIQDGAGGIAQALSLAENFAAGDDLAVILSDNIFGENFAEEVMYFKGGAQIFVKQVEDASRFGVVELREDHSVRSVEEKPSFPKSHYAQTGLYLYDNRVFELIRQIQPSKRGELEITDVNNLYLKKKELKARVFTGLWADAGTHDSLLEASLLVSENAGGDLVRLVRTDKNPADQVAPKVSIGLLTHNSEKYLKPCLDSLFGQHYENLEITILDNASTDQTVRMIREQYPSVNLIESPKNLGFGAGHNRLINQTDGDFYACLNIDMIFELNFINELVKSVDEKPIYGSSGPKLKRWDFSAFQDGAGGESLGKTNFLDTVGLRMNKHHRFTDIGQGEVDNGQFDSSAFRFGFSGAAVLYRRKALDDIAFVTGNGSKEYFDENMFMYKEDIDLAYRLQWAGWKARFTPQAIAHHDRTIAATESKLWGQLKNRSKKSRQVNQDSYLNHHILLQKNYVKDYSLGVQRATGWYNFKVFMYLLLLEQETLGQWWKLLRLRSQIKQRRRAIKRRVTGQEMESLMEG